MNKILIIEDDETIKNELITLLRTNGYQTVEDYPCDLALLDVNLPGKSGFTICRELREKSRVPVIFLTARDTPEDELLAFGVGADDFIRKPYNSSVLLARISRCLKSSTAGAILTSNGMELHLAEMKLKFESQETELTRNETRIMACLMQKELCTKTDLIEDLWANSMYIDENTLYVNIGRLREKMTSIGAGTAIRTVRGVGYCLQRL